MRRYLLFFIPILILSLAIGAWAMGKGVSIQVRQGQVRSKPTYLSKVLGTLAYGERLVNLGQKGEWLKIKSGSDLSGWVHVSAVTEKKIILSSGKTKAGLKASDEELILAGKGFNQAVEEEYRAKNPKAAFARVDRAEKEHNPDQERITAFLKNGRLKSLGLEIKAKKKTSSNLTEEGGSDNAGR